MSVVKKQCRAIFLRLLKIFFETIFYSGQWYLLAQPKKKDISEIDY